MEFSADNAPLDADGRNAQSSAMPPDPDPDDAPGSGSGGGVEPGETPPDSGSTSQSANHNPTPTTRFPPTMIAALIAAGIFVAVFLVIAVLYFLQATGVMERW